MAAITSTKTIPLPASTFISVKIGTLKLGTLNLKSSGKNAKDPEVIQSLTVIKLNSDFSTDKSGNADADNTKSNKSNKSTKVTSYINNSAIDYAINPKDTSKNLLYQSMTLTLNTANNIELEKKLLDIIRRSTEQQAKVTVRYGYVNGARSFLYTGFISDMDCTGGSDFYTMVLTISHSNGTDDKYSNFKNKTIKAIKKHFKTKDKNGKKIKNPKRYQRYSDLVKDIAKNQGWKIGTIVNTNKIGKNSIKPPNTSKQSPLNYIDSFRKKATSGKGGKYVSRFRFNDNGDVVYEFAPERFINNAGYRAKKSYNFVMGMLPNGVVISFRPTLTKGLGLAADFQISNKISTNGKKGKELKKIQSANKAIEKSNKQNNKKFKNIYGVITGDTKEVTDISYTLQNTKKNSKNLSNADDEIIAINAAAVRSNVSSKDAANYAESIIKNNFSKYAYSVSQNATATMEIIGDPKLQIGDLINVLPMYPASNKGSIMHPSGGTYRIIGLTDTVGANYTTSVTLVRENNTKTLKKITTKKKPDKNKNKQTDKKPAQYKVGDKVNFKGGKYYISSYKGSKGQSAKAGPAKITKINKQLLKTKGAHPYHIVHTDKKSNVYGWVDANSI